jgi:hypothetical protein
MNFRVARPSSSQQQGIAITLLLSSLASQRHHRAAFALLCGGGGHHNGQERHSTDTETPFRKLPLDMFSAVCWTSGFGVNSRVLRYPNQRAETNGSILSSWQDQDQHNNKRQWMTFSHQSMTLLHQWMIFVGH